MKHFFYTGFLISLPLAGYFLGRSGDWSIKKTDQVKEYRMITPQVANTLFLEYFTKTESPKNPTMGLLFSKAFLNKVLTTFTIKTNSYVRFYYASEGSNKGIMAMEVMPDGTDKTDKILLSTGVSGFDEGRVCPNACDLNSSIIQGAVITK